MSGRSFSRGEPVDSIETEKSRIVLKELDEGWWILAVGRLIYLSRNRIDIKQSISLTRLPSLPTSSTSSSKKGAETSTQKPTVEYSSREVSPPALLLEQLKQAHYIFCLHHGSSLTDIWSRLGRDKFCGILDRYWVRFSRSWDVLLHGNPAVDVLSGLKLSSGGELGFGVGEEEWGSGERDVLEGFPRRTEGLLDIVVSRFGEPGPEIRDENAIPESEVLPWMGSGREPMASDGVVFGGVGAIDRHSLRDVSLWMRHIYTYGEYAYGIKDNVHRERRKRRRPKPPEQSRVASESRERSAVSRHDQALRATGEVAGKHRASSRNDTAKVVSDRTPAPGSSKSSQSDGTSTLPNANLPDSHNDLKVPPPIVSAVEQALEDATDQADKDAETSGQDGAGSEAEATTLGIPDTYMKYLTFGLSTLSKPAAKTRLPSSRNVSTSTKQPIQPKAAPSVVLEDEDEPLLTQLQPMPDG